MAISTLVHVLNHRFVHHSDWGSDATARFAMRVDASTRRQDEIESALEMSNTTNVHMGLQNTDMAEAEADLMDIGMDDMDMDMDIDMDIDMAAMSV